MSSTIGKDVVRIIKVLIFLFLEVLLFFILTRWLGGIYLPDLKTAFIIILSLSIVNALLWPLISYISLRFIVFTLGFGTFLIDGILLKIISMFTPGVTIGHMALFSVPLLIGVISSFLSLILNIDDDDTYYRYVLKKELEHGVGDIPNKSGFIFLEIDGLARNILEQAIDRGDMPTLKKWIDNGSHKLTKWETDLSSQTGSSQAGILHGNNDNIPAFRWVEKTNDNKVVSSNGFSGAPLIENRISDGNGLLSLNGASRGNLFSGDAKDYLLTFSKLGTVSSFYTRSWYSIYSSPFFIARILILFLWDMILELCSRVHHALRNIKPRLLTRGFLYFIARAGANVVMREASTFALIGDIFAGEYNVIYTTYMGYDEIAHHSGIRDYDAFYALRQIDKQFKHIEHAVKSAKRDYKIIVLSDHGQSEGSTFKQEYGLTLNDLVKEYLPENVTVHSILHSNDDHFIEQYSLRNYAMENKKKFGDKMDETFDDARNKLSELRTKASSSLYIDELKKRKDLLIGDEPFVDRLNRAANEIGIDLHLPKDDVVSLEDAQTIVLASGNLGLIYFTDWSTRLTYEQLEDAFPGLVHGIASHPGIGFVMVKSSIYGTICLCDDSVYYFDDDRYVGKHFLDVFGENVIDHLKRTDSFDYVPDILVNSIYDTFNDEVHAFEELIGSHGGVGGTQQEPFILYPSTWNLDEPIVGAENVYKFFKKEIKDSWNKKED